jgi:hypothetical protein
MLFQEASVAIRRVAIIALYTLVVATVPREVRTFLVARSRKVSAAGRIPGY